MKRLIVGLVLFLILGLIAYIMNDSANSSTIRSELSDFAVKDTASVTKVTLKSASGELVTLDRVEDGKWTVNNKYTARPDAVDILLSTMNKLSVKSPVNQAAMDHTFRNIISNHTLVTVYASGDEPIKAFYVGGSNQDHTGTNMMIKGSSRPFVVHIEGFHGFLTPRFFTNELEWRSREVFGYKVEEIAELSLAYTDKPNENFHFQNHGEGNLILTRGVDSISAPFDTLLLNAYLDNYKMVHYESYEETKTEAFVDSVKASKPIFTIRLQTDEDDRIVHGYRKPMKGATDYEGNPLPYDIDRLYIWVDSNELYVAQYAIFDKLTAGVYFFK